MSNRNCPANRCKVLGDDLVRQSERDKHAEIELIGNLSCAVKTDAKILLEGYMLRHIFDDQKVGVHILF